MMEAEGEEHVYVCTCLRGWVGIMACACPPRFLCIVPSLLPALYLLSLVMLREDGAAIFKRNARRGSAAAAAGE